MVLIAYHYYVALSNKVRCNNILRFIVTVIVGCLLSCSLFLLNVADFVPTSSFFQQQQTTNNNDPCSTLNQSAPVANQLCNRRRNIEKVCSTQFRRQFAWFDGFLTKTTANRIFPPNFLVSEETKMLYCSIPKVASTTWRNYFGQLKNFLSNSSSFSSDVATSTPSLRRLSDYSPQQVHEILEKYTKIVWIRDPLQRLVSAWRDKLLRNNTYYSKEVGSKIISRYRNNASADDIETGFPSSLEEFFRYLAEEPVRNYDVHWKSQAQICLLCKIHWDFYGALENMQEESEFIIQQSLVKTIPDNSSSSNNNQHHRQIRDNNNRQSLPKLPVLNRVQRGITAAGDNLQVVLEQIPPQLLQNVLQRGYKYDFAILGYAMPPANVNKIDHSNNNNNVTLSRQLLSSSIVINTA